MRFSMRSIFLLICFFLSGCATILDGPTQKIVAHCTPPDGVMVEINGKQVPYVDGYLDLEKKRPVHFITFRKEGYYENTLSFNHQINPFWPVADAIFVFAYPIAVFTDWYTGSFYKIKPNDINIVLRKKEN